MKTKKIKYTALIFVLAGTCIFAYYSMTKSIKNDNKAIAKYFWIMQNDSVCGVISSF